MKKRVVAAFLTVAFVSSVLPKSVMANPADDTIVTENKAQGLTISDLEEQIQEETLSTGQQQTVDALTEQVTLDPEAVAEELNQIAEENPEDSNYVEKAAEGVLDELFEENSYDQEAIDKIKENNTSSIVEDKIEDYEEAKQERDNAENLDYEPGKVIVSFEEGASMEDVEELAETLGGSYEVLMSDHIEIGEDVSEGARKRLEEVKDIPLQPIVAVDLNLDQTTEEGKEQFEEYEIVDSVSHNIYYEPTEIKKVVNDEKVSKQWYLDAINVEPAWECSLTAGCIDDLVSVIDTGTFINHPELKGRIDTRHSVDITQRDAAGEYKKLGNEKYENQHGTYVAGVIAASSNNKIGIAGVGSGKDNSNCKLMAVKTWRDGIGLDDSAIIKAINYSVSAGAHVINMSFRALFFEDSTHTSYKAAINNAYKQRVSLVAAAGNDGIGDACFPASYDHVISVAATDKKNQRRNDPNWWASNYGPTIDISAPGESILTLSGNNEYDFIDGTSLSAPIVTGVIANMYAVNPSLTPDEIETILKKTATSINTDKMMGAGLVNAGKAVQEAKYREASTSSYKVKIKSATALGGNKVKVVLFPELYGPERLRLYRSTKKDSGFQSIKLWNGDSVDQTDMSYTDSGLKSGQTYYYQAKAYIKYGDKYKLVQTSNIISVKAK